MILTLISTVVKTAVSDAQGWKKYFIFWDRNEKWKNFSASCRHKSCII
jgi:hypothetical protein